MLLKIVFDADSSPTRSPPAKLLVFDSSFNPPTIAHQQIILDSIAHLRNSNPALTVLLLLSISNADKADLLPEEVNRRVELITAFVGDLMQRCLADAVPPSIHWQIACIEGAPLFLQKDAVIRSQYPATADEVIYAVGDDTFGRLLDRKYYDPKGFADLELGLVQFFGHCSLLVFQRKYPDLEDLIASQSNQCGKLIATKCRWLDTTANIQQCSSTLVRQLRSNHSNPEHAAKIKGLLTPSVFQTFCT